MRSIALWLKKRFGTFDLLPGYFTAVGQRTQDVLWGALLPFLAWGIWFIVSSPPTWVNVTAIGIALFLAGYYVWRADHVRLISQFEIPGFFRHVVDTLDDEGLKNGWAVYYQLSPRCRAEADVNDCRGFLTSIEMWDGFNNDWQNIDTDVLPLEWSYAGFDSITLHPQAERRLNVFYIHSNSREIRPCVNPLPTRFFSIFNQLSLKQVRAIRFHIRVVAKDCPAVSIKMSVQLGNDPFQPFVELEKVNSE